MVKVLNLKVRINKSNGQMNFSIPKKKLSKKKLKEIFATKKIKISIEK